MAKAEKSPARDGKAVAVVEDAANLPAMNYDYGAYAGEGFEDMGRDDYATPFLYVLQPTSPITTLDDNARPGMLMDSVSQEMWKAEKSKGAEHAGVAFIPCHRQHLFVEWKKRDEKGGGGGYVGQHEVGSAVVEAAKKKYDFGKLEQNGNDLIETFYVYGLLIKPDGTWQPMVLPFTSTKIKAYKHWMTRLANIKVNGQKPPLWAHRARITTLRQENDKGVFYIMEIAFDGDNAIEARLDPTSEIFQEAAEFYRLCKDGVAKPDYTSPGAAEAAGGAVVDAEIPF